MGLEVIRDFKVWIYSFITDFICIQFSTDATHQVLNQHGTQQTQNHYTPKCGVVSVRDPLQKSSYATARPANEAIMQMEAIVLPGKIQTISGASSILIFLMKTGKSMPSGSRLASMQTPICGRQRRPSRRVLGRR